MDKKSKPLTTKEIIAELNANVRMYVFSYREIDGCVRDRDALYSIACLRKAIDLIRRSGAKAHNRACDRKDRIKR